MKYSSTCLAAFVLLLLFSGESLAHRVNVFAFVDGAAIQVECAFSKSQKVKNGRLLVSDLETGAAVLEGVTDEQGVFRFRPSEAFLETGHGLNVRLLAGEGHQDDWQIMPDELAALAQPGLTGQNAPAPVPAAETQPEMGPDIYYTVSQAELEALVGKVLDTKLAPIRQALVRQQDSGPDLKDIIGGLGWILGLLGLATYLKYRR